MFTTTGEYSSRHVEQVDGKAMKTEYFRGAGVSIALSLITDLSISVLKMENTAKLFLKIN